MRGDAVRLKFENDSLDIERETRSFATTESGRDGGAGEVGRLMGLKKEGVLRACIASDVVLI